MVTGLLASSCSVLGGGDDGAAAADAAEDYLTAWVAGDPAAMAAAVADPPADFAAVHQQFRSSLGVVGGEISGVAAETSGGEGTATFSVTLRLQGVGRWRYDGAVDVVSTDAGWKVAFDRAALHPALGEAGTLRLVRQQGLRAQILAAGGQPLAVGGPGEGERIDDLAGGLVGSLRPIDATEATRRGLRYAAGDLVGDEGVEFGFEERLNGDPVGRIEALDAAGAVTEVVHEFGGERPEPLTLTVDYATQRAAERAVADVALPVALVAVDAGTGAIRAVANNPTGFDRALLGEYPPGSTFKIVTAAAALEAGTAPDQVLPCPFETRPGDSAPFTNAFGEDYGDLPFIETFAVSCNTTFVDLGYGLGPQRLLEEAEAFGFNRRYDIGVPTSAPSFPLPESDTEVAAAAIGQGRVSATPLHMATVAAAAYDGTWRPPYLAGEPREDGARPLAPPAQAALPDFMREAVVNGTGEAVAIIGRDVGGKTGTAEFGDEDPPETHAWFAGFVGDLAYAVVVEGGGVGGEVAAPIARAFLLGLPAPPIGPGALPEADPPAPD